MSQDDFFSPHLQPPLPPIFVSIREFTEQRDRFKIDPPFQRKQAWSKIMKQAWIDTLLRGDPVPPLEAYEEWGEYGEKWLVIHSGHQRTQAIRDFVDGKFRTWTPAEKRKAEPGSEPPVEPRKLFPALDPRSKNYLLDLHLQINLVRKTSDEQIRTRFLRIENQVPLNMAEKLNSFMSEANTIARRIEKHSFWEDIYDGRTNREQIFQSSLQLLAIELSAPSYMCDVQSLAALQTLASGKQDKTITDSTLDTVLTRLDLVAHVYHGMHFTIRAACIVMYQSVALPEQVGYSIKQHDKGRLTPWLNGLVLASQRASGIPNYDQPLQLLVYKSNQKAFWNRHLSTVMSLFGLTEVA